MKKTIKLFAIGFSAILFLLSGACTKNGNNSTTPAASGSNQWTINDTTYKGITTGTGLFDDTLVSSDATILNGQIGNANYAVVIMFGKVPVAGTYTVLNQITVDTSQYPPVVLTSTQCVIFGESIIKSANNQGFEFFSAGKVGDVVTVTVSGGKVAATFSNISVFELNVLSDVTTNATLSGNITQP